MSKAHRSQRPKGYLSALDWTPKVTRTMDQAQVIEWVLDVIRRSSYEVSVRFIFYRLVGNHGYPKTEQAYNNLAELLVKARRAGLVPFNAITDSDPALAGGSWGFGKRADFLRWRAGVSGFTLDPLPTQPYRIELWSEDAGSVPMLAGISRGYPVTVYSTGGFSSVTVTYDIAQRVAERDVPTIFLHIGDFDPSGESIFTAMSQDVGAFLSADLGCSWDEHTGETYNCEDQCLNESGEGSGPDFRPIRVALTRDQAEEWNLETAPPKASDSRSANWIGETVQVQAMSEQQMEQVVRSVLDEHTDHDAMEELKEREEELRDEMAPLVKEAMESVIKELGEED